MAKREVENDEYFKMVCRMIKAGAKRAGNADDADLFLLASLLDVVESSIKGAIHQQLDQGKTWEKIGLALGVSRQCAHRKYGRILK